MTLCAVASLATTDSMRTIFVSSLFAQSSVAPTINKPAASDKGIAPPSTSTPEDESRQPFIAIPSRVDFGDVKPGDKLTATVSITNVLSHPVKIHRVTTTCSCTAGVLNTKTIGPGESVSLSITFQAPRQAGISSLQRVTVIPDIRNGLPVVIQVAGTTRDVIKTELVSIQEQTGALSGFVHLWSLDGQTFRVLGYTSLFGVDPDPQQEFTIPFKILADEEGRVARRIGIRTDHPKQPLVAVSLDKLITLPLVSDAAGVRFRRDQVEPAPKSLRIRGAVVRTETVYSVLLPGWRDVGSPEIRLEPSAPFKLRVIAAEQQEHGVRVDLGFTPKGDRPRTINSTVHLIGSEQESLLRIDARTVVPVEK